MTAVVRFTSRGPSTLAIAGALDERCRVEEGVGRFSLEPATNTSPPEKVQDGASEATGSGVVGLPLAELAAHVVESSVEDFVARSWTGTVFGSCTSPTASTMIAPMPSCAADTASPWWPSTENERLVEQNGAADLA